MNSPFCIVIPAYHHTIAIEITSVPDDGTAGFYDAENNFVELSVGQIINLPQGETSGELYYFPDPGADLSQLSYYRAFNSFKTACILHGVYARYRAGQKSTEGVDVDMLFARIGLAMWRTPERDAHQMQMRAQRKHNAAATADPGNTGHDK